MQNQTCIWHNFVGSFFLLLDSYAVMSSYIHICMYMYMQTYNCLLSIDCFCFSICLFSTILIILCLSEIEQNTTLVFLPDRLKVQFVLLMDFKKKNQYPFIMQHELHWNRKIRLSQSINEAKHLLCVNARAKERVSEWVSVNQPASTKPGRRKRILFCGSQRLTSRQAVDVVVGRDLPQ